MRRSRRIRCIGRIDEAGHFKTSVPDGDALLAERLSGISFVARSGRADGGGDLSCDSHFPVGDDAGVCDRGCLFDPGGYENALGGGFAAGSNFYAAAGGESRDESSDRGAGGSHDRDSFWPDAHGFSGGAENSRVCWVRESAGDHGGGASVVVGSAV